MRKLIAVASVLAAVALAGAVVAASASSASTQKVRCIYKGKEYACKTPMRLVCHKSGKTILSRIPRNVFWYGYWHIALLPGYSSFGASGPPVRHRKLSVTTPGGARREEAIVNLAPLAGETTGTGKQVLIWARCK